MAAVDPFAELVKLGVITPQEVKEATRVDKSVATTISGCLLAVGVDGERLLDALSKIGGIPRATKSQVAASSPASIANVSPKFATAMREMMAAPIGRGDDGTLEVLVADPSTTKKLSAIGIGHRAFLAHEMDVIDAIDRVWPPAAAVVPASASGDEEPVTIKSGTPRPISFQSSDSVADSFASIAPARAPDVAAFQRTSPEPAAKDIRAARRTAADVERHRNPFLTKARRRTLVIAGSAGAMAIAVVIVVVVVRLLRPPLPEDPSAKQRRELAEARSLAARGDHAWAFARCSDAMQIDPTSATGKEAAILCAEQNVLLGERDSLVDLRRMIDAMAPGDPLRAEAEATWKRLSVPDPACDACSDVDAGTSEKVQSPPKRASSPKRTAARKGTHR